MRNQKIVVLMGSKSDYTFAQRIGNFLEKSGFTVKCEYSVSSAHKTPDILLDKLKKYAESGDAIVFVTVAGLSDALSGVVAGTSTYPVIACPPDIEASGWAKAFSSIMTPTGVPVLLVSTPENAAFAALKILALRDSLLRVEIERFMDTKRKEITQVDKQIASKNQ